MKHEVFWKNPYYKPFPYLHTSTSCDYLIVGGGVTGISLAYFLAKGGMRNVVVCEKHTIASGATGHAAGSLVASGELDFRDLVHEQGSTKSKAHWKLLGKTVEDIKQIIRKEQVKCDFEEHDTLYCGLTKTHEGVLSEEYRYLKSVNPQTTLLEGDQLKETLNSPLFTKAILSQNNGISVNPLQFTQNFAHVVARKGVRIYEHTPVTRVEGHEATTPQGVITFKNIIWAIDAAHPDDDVLNNKTTIVITRPLTSIELKMTGLIKKKIVWDADNHYGYLKLTKENRFLIGAGDVKVHKHYNNHDPHFPHLDRAKRWITNLFPYLKVDFDYAWSATYGTTKKHFPIVEEEGKRHSYAIAGAGSQVVCVMAARQLANKLLGRPHRLDLLYL